MARKDKYSQDKLNNIKKEQAKKTARRKAKKRLNAALRERGDKFSYEDACYVKKTTSITVL